MTGATQSRPDVGLPDLDTPHPQAVIYTINAQFWVMEETQAVDERLREAEEHEYAHFNGCISMHGKAELTDLYIKPGYVLGFQTMTENMWSDFDPKNQQDEEEGGEDGHE